MPRRSLSERALEVVPSFAQNYEFFCENIDLNFKSVETRVAYKRGLCGFVTHFRKAPEDLTPREITSYYTHLVEQKGLSDSTLKFAVNGIRHYYSFLGIPLPRVATPRVNKEKKIRIPLSESETDNLLRSTGDDYFSKALLATYLDTGVRLGEGTRIELSDLDFDRGKIAVRCGKGMKGRFVPFSPVLQAVVRRHLAVNKPKTYLFESAPGVPVKPHQVTATLQTYKEKAGIAKHISPHHLRHTFASLLAFRGVSPDQIKEWLGHKWTSTTLSYIHSLGVVYGTPASVGPLGLMYAKKAGE